MVFAGRESLAVTCTTGLAIVAHLLFAMAALGALHRVPLLFLAIVLIVAGVLRRGWVWPRLHWIMLAVLPVFLLALSPPVEFDETLYHLPLIRAVAESGTLAFRSYLRFPLFPQFQELLSVPAFLFAGDSATHMISLAEGILTVALLLEWGRRRGSPAGVLAAAAFAGGPVIIHLASSGYVEVGLTLFVTAGFYCLDRKWIFGAGLFFGTACDVKYLALYFAGMAGLWLLFTERPRLRAAALFTAGLLTSVLPTYLGILLRTADPLFPFLRASPWQQPFVRHELLERVLTFVRIPWDVTFARSRIGFQPPFTPLFAIALLAVILGTLRDSRARAVAVMTVTYMGVFTVLPPDSRYLVALLPVLFLTAAETLRLRPSLVPWVAVLVLLPGPAYAVFRLVRSGLPPVTAQQRLAYLDRALPEYRALRRAGRANVYGCGVEQLLYYAEAPFYADLVGPFNLDGVRPEMVLVSKRACPRWRPDRRFERVYEDDGAELWRRVESRR